MGATDEPRKTVAIIGAGHAGLAAAALVPERGMTPVVIETGPEAGHAVCQWRHPSCSRPGNTTSAARLLAPAGRNSPDPAVYSTGAELLKRYIEPLATKTVLHDMIRTNSRVSAVGRVGLDKAKTKGREVVPFEIRYQSGRGLETLRADAVIDASGRWSLPNPAGTGGLPALGEREFTPRIAYGMPDVLGGDRSRYACKDDPEFYLASMKSYRRAPTFLMVTGYDQVRSIVAGIAGDKEAAESVELELPETGVCIRSGVEGGAAGAGCCGGPAPVIADTCCAGDATAEAAAKPSCC
ncbi:FAD-dependent oxidoreductase [Bradyrhizobium sp. SZCCHNS2005]|uniref:FAD-dependent oxidoreductase n=1 Tax=Bradyrhizobium sp. SZCCHNS2005 TaxID=3057303 RepID=UPI0028EA7FCD|nr:FAD-dependent oxidoreductase [Bradyrhizobium sp. SZCCHNS2005]